MPLKTRLSASFHNFWPGFEPERSFFARALRERFDLRIERVGADVQFFSVFGAHFPQEVIGSSALKVWFSGENDYPRHLIYDLHFGFEANPLLGARFIRYPLWIIYIDWWEDGPLGVERLTGPRRFEPRSAFCNFIYSNPASFRIEMLETLGRRRAVDSLGGVLNSGGGRVADKIAALRQYQFTLAFENCRAPGYVTEKLLEPLAAGSIPVYWGADEARRDFNPAAFINATGFPDLDALSDHVVSVAQDMDAMLALAEAPVFADGIPSHHRPAYFADRIEEALDTPGLRGAGRELNARLQPYKAPTLWSRWKDVRRSARDWLGAGRRRGGR